MNDNSPLFTETIQMFNLNDNNNSNDDPDELNDILNF